MFKKLILLGFTLSVFAASTVSAASMCAPGLLSTYMASGFSCSMDNAAGVNEIFSNFMLTALPNANTVSQTATGANIMVTPQLLSGGTFGIFFSYSGIGQNPYVSAMNQQQQIVIDYTLTSLVPPIRTVTGVVRGGSATGIGAYSFVKTLFDGVNANVVTPPITQMTAQTSSAAIIPSRSSTNVEDSFQLSNTASVVSYGNIFSVPEPMTFLMLGSGLVGLALLRRKKV